jgi:hypothetical protein
VAVAAVAVADAGKGRPTREEGRGDVHRTA